MDEEQAIARFRVWLADEDQKPRDHTLLFPNEVQWRDHQQWLEKHGYLLRPRLRPGWVPSWTGTKKLWVFCEDGRPISVRLLFGCIYHANATDKWPWADAIRMSNGEVVVIKRISKSTNPYEVDISRMFSAGLLASDPRNHCVPVYDILQSPLDDDIVFIVIQFLRPFNAPRRIRLVFDFELYVTDDGSQGLQFMHEYRVAHRDIKRNNVMMSPVPFLSEIPHPIFDKKSYDFRRKITRTTRTAARPKYCYIDFGISRRYPQNCISPRKPPFQDSDKPHDPFPTDVYYLGELFRQHFILKSHGFEILESLVADMIQTDPSRRPTMEEVAQHFSKILADMSPWKLRSRIVHREEFAITGFFRAIGHVFRTMHELPLDWFERYLDNDPTLNLVLTDKNGLYRPEIWWRDHQDWLEERGYILRPRLRHGWVPSWQGTKQSWLFCEDGASILNDEPDEPEISRMFSVEPLASDPRNHCVPVYEVMQSPLDDDIVFIVIPFLRPFEKPPFRTSGEALECMRQLIQGLHLMHEHHGAHRQVELYNNIMMSPVPFLSEMPHPRFPKKSYDFRRRIKCTTRTTARPKYYFIDFGMSYKYPKDCVAPRAPPVLVDSRTVPEFEGPGLNELHDPFPADIYCLGELFRSVFTQV
ncbi:kinase-like domain-containing protein [Epithele typhae]|uniref:kinase-like domain-containing protein n=1 Tax=Epithele typhae TaxID=378194 RepID=UPI002007EAF5|nr:kinase-like domain-containing protein [Epithele typhae]KAH9941292.1 kinase-like domain-containing protein [Epithele typhae]